jgi:hypothetical protein
MISSPVHGVRAVPVERVRANSYNPNVVAPPEMTLLEQGIWEDGYTQPVVCTREPDGTYEIVVGYHRYRVMMTSDRVRERERGLLPVVVIDSDGPRRMAATIRHNRARGTHAVELMSQIVTELVEAGMSDAWIQRHIGMEPDELLRLKQITGIAALLADHDFTTLDDPDGGGRPGTGVRTTTEVPRPSPRGGPRWDMPTPPLTRCALVLDQTAPRWLLVNAAAVLAATAAARLDVRAGADLPDASGAVWPGMVEVAFPLLTAPAAGLRTLMAHAEDRGLLALAFTAPAQQATRYEDFATRLGALVTSDVAVHAIAIAGAPDLVRLVTRGLARLS